MTQPGCAIENPVNSAATSQTMPATSTPRTTAASVKAPSSSPGDSGATSRSTIVPCILAMNIDDAVFKNAFWISDSITRPGTMKRT